MRDTLADAPDLLAWALENGCRLRFIEQMPLDADRVLARENMVPAAELLAVLGERFTLVEAGRDDPSAPAEEWLGGRRPRDGRHHRLGHPLVLRGVRPHAHHRRGHRALVPVRRRRDRPARRCCAAAPTTPRSRDWWRAAMWGKQAGHGMDAAGFAPPVRSMGAIGG